VPGMFGDLGGESPPANLMEVKAREAQGHHREVLSEGSVERRCEPTDRNWISRRQGRTSWRETAKSLSIKGRQRKSSGCALKVIGLTPGGLLFCFRFGTGGVARSHNGQQESANGIVVPSLGERRPERYGVASRR